MIQFVKKYLFFAAVALLFLPLSASAALLDGITCIADGSCHTCDFVKLMVTWSQFALGIISLFALVTLVIGGFFWLISAGNPERVQRGRQIMLGSLTGVILAFTSYMIINFTIAAFTGQSFASTANLSGKSWSKVVCSQ